MRALWVRLSPWWRYGHRPLSAQLLAPQKSQFFLDMIEQPIALFETLRSNFVHLANRLKMHLNVHASPTVITEPNDILNRGMLLLVIRITKACAIGRLER